MSAQTPREIAFEDIRASDRLRARRVEDGIEYTREGVAHKNAYGGWFTSEGGLIVSADSGATITLLHRPAPAEPKGLGAVVRARRVARSCSPALFVLTPPCAEGGEILPDWVDGNGDLYYWSHLDPESIEVLSEGIEVES